MTEIYGEQHRTLQKSFDTVQLADRVKELIVLPEIPDDHKSFIESRDMVEVVLINRLLETEGNPAPPPSWFQNGVTTDITENSYALVNKRLASSGGSVHTRYDRRNQLFVSGPRCHDWNNRCRDFR